MLCTMLFLAFKLIKEVLCSIAHHVKFSNSIMRIKKYWPKNKNATYKYLRVEMYLLSCNFLIPLQIRPGSGLLPLLPAVLLGCRRLAPPTPPIKGSGGGSFTRRRRRWNATGRLGEQKKLHWKGSVLPMIFLMSLLKNYAIYRFFDVFRALASAASWAPQSARPAAQSRSQCSG